MKPSFFPTNARNWLLKNSVVLVAFVLANSFTNAWLMGDTVDYVDSISAYDQGRHLQFWEFGHLLWRPFGWLSFRLAEPITHLLYSGDQRAKITFTLMAINWIGALACVLTLAALTRHVCKNEWIVSLSTLGFLFSAAFLNYSQTGSAYVPGLALVLLAVFILLRNSQRPEPSRIHAFGAGIILAAAVCLWIPFILLLPAALTAPLFLVRFDMKITRSLIWTVVALSAVTIVAYIVVLLTLGIRSPEALQTWVTAAAHGMDRMRGVPRMIFGFANSLIDLGGDGATYKRYLRHDPYNSVSAADLFRSSLWKLLFCYLFLAGFLLTLLLSKNRGKFLGLLLMNFVPTIIFALFIFEAGDTSRYIVTLPIFFLVVAYAACHERAHAWFKYLLVLFISILIITNVRAMSSSKSRLREERNLSRVNELLPLLKPNSIVMVSHLQDDLANFTRDFLFNPVIRNNNLHYVAVLAINTSQVDHWRQESSEQITKVWAKNGDVWLTRRLLSPRPRWDWNWVEGDDPRVSWIDLYNHFSKFETGQAVGGDDGFVLLLPSERNKELLATDSQGVRRK